ncbi:glutathione S-transferase [Seiridium cupressi]
MAQGKPTLVHLNNSQSQTILWLLEELGIEYELKLFERINGRAPPELKKTHPMGKSPQLITATGRVITERSAIALYLIETYDKAGKFKIASPPSDPEYDAVREDSIISFGNATISPFFMLRFILMQLIQHTPFFVRPLVSGLNFVLGKAFLNSEIELNMDYLESILKDRDYLMGGREPTRADFVNLLYADWGYHAKLYDTSKYVNIEAWRSRCTSRPAWLTALEKGNGYYK